MNDPWLALALGLAGGIALGVVYYFLRLQPRLKQEARKAEELQRQIDRTQIELDQLKQNLDGRNELLRLNNDELSNLREQLSNSRSDISRLDADLINAKKVVDEHNSLLEKREREKDTLNVQLQKANNEVTRLTSELGNSEDKAEFLEKAKTQLSDAFKVLADTALDETSKKFREVAQDDTEKSRKAVADLVKPLSETLSKLETRTEKLADERKESHTRLGTEIEKLMKFSHQAQDEVRKLSQAMSQSQTRGNWGEFVLEQILKFSGLQENTHYDKQITLQITDSKHKARPDYIIKLPNGRKIVVDAKTSFTAFENAAMAEDENKRSDYLRQHADQVQANLDKLARADYLPFIQEKYGETATPDYVVMFLPSDALYHAALEQLPKLAQEGFQKRVILTSPTTLFALIGVIHLGFRENALAAEAEEIGKKGNELYKRSIKLVEFIGNIGSGLTRSVKSYNEAIGSLNRRYIPQVEKFKELKSLSSSEIPELKEISDSLQQPRLLRAPDNLTDEDDNDLFSPNS